METKLKLEDVVKELNKQTEYQGEVIKTGIFSLDLIFPNGIDNEVIQIAGDSGTSKTQIALQLSQAYCQQNKKVLYLNTQNSITQDRLKQLSLDKYLNSKFFFYKAETFKKAEEILDKFIATDEIDLIIVDSIANLVNDGYLNIEHKGKSKGISIDNYNSNYDTRPLSLFIRKYSALSSDRHFSLVLVSAMRQKIHKTLGTIDRRFGPKSLDGCCSTIIKINKSKSNKFAKRFESIISGYTLEFELIKSTILRPNLKIPFFVEYGYGIKDIYNLIHYFLETGILRQNNCYYEFSDIQIKTQGIQMMINELIKYTDFLNNKYRKPMEEYYKTQNAKS